MRQLTAREAFSYMWGARRSDSTTAIHYAFGRMVDKFGHPEATKIALYIDEVKFHYYTSERNSEIDTSRLTNFEFNSTSSGVRAYRLWLAIKRNNELVAKRGRIQLKSKRTRKQEEAPEAQAVDGAESSLKLCDGCKNTFQNDYDVCPDCSQLGGA